MCKDRQQLAARSPSVEERCPFLGAGADLCQAACSSSSPDLRRLLLYCNTDDFDACPLFLARALRSTRPKARLETWPLHQK